MPELKRNNQSGATESRRRPESINRAHENVSGPLRWSHGREAPESTAMNLRSICWKWIKYWSHELNIAFMGPI
jgi:hypothetical protein